MTPRTVRDAFLVLAEAAQRKAAGETILNGGAAGGPAGAWRNIAGLLSEWVGWCTPPPAPGARPQGDAEQAPAAAAAPTCAFAGRAHAGHVKWAIAACLKIATASGEEDALGLREWMVDQLAPVPAVADDKAIPAVWLWSALARQAQAHAQALPQPAQDGEGRLGIMQGQLFVPMHPAALQQLRVQALHLAQVREGLIGDLSMMLEYLNPMRHLHALGPAPRGGS